MKQTVNNSEGDGIMRITAVAVGTRGDVNPLVELGQEMIKYGHEFRILTMEKFRPLIEGKGVTYLHLDGDADHVLESGQDVRRWLFHLHLTSIFMDV